MKDKNELIGMFKILNKLDMMLIVLFNKLDLDFLYKQEKLDRIASQKKIIRRLDDNNFEISDTLSWIRNLKISITRMAIKL